MECKNILLETEGDIEKAIEILKQRNLFKAEKKKERVTAEGIIEAYIHAGGRIGVLVEVNSETDFVARNPEFQAFVNDVAMHIAALAPKYLGVKAVIAKSFARIHLANLVNFGIVPLTFANKQDYAAVAQGDMLELDLKGLQRNLCMKNVETGVELGVTFDLGDREKDLLKAGGKLAAVKAKHSGN